MRKLLWIAVYLFAFSLLGIFFTLRSYRAFTHEELVATVRCERDSKGKSSPFTLEVTPVVRRVRGAPQRFSMWGEQWSIGGDILKWHPWVNWVGLRNCHRLTRLSSRYLKAEDELEKPRSAYDLNGGTSLTWLLLYRMGRWIPFVEAVYGNSAYTLARPAGEWGVYVTLSGYLIKPLRAGKTK